MDTTTATNRAGEPCDPESPEAYWIEVWKDYGGSQLAVGPAHPLYEEE